MSSARSTRVTSRLPLGLVTIGLLVVVAVALATMSLRNSPNAGSGPAGSTPSSVASTTSDPGSPIAKRTGSQTTGTGVAISAAQAVALPGTAHPVSVVALIRNNTGKDIKLRGASSPIAKTAGLYATSGEMPDPSDTTGMSFLRPMPWWLIPAGQSIELRRGDGEIVLSGLAGPLTEDHVQVTFLFEGSDPVTVSVPVAK